MNCAVCTKQLKSSNSSGHCREHYAKSEKWKTYVKEYRKKNINRHRSVVNAWYEKNKDSRNAVLRENYCPAKARTRRIKSIYGLSEDQHGELLTSQKGVCAICHKAPERSVPLAIDHSHVTGRVRGLLCRSCNTGIGFLKDNPQVALSALKYLLRNQELDHTAENGDSRQPHKDALQILDTLLGGSGA